MRDPKAVLVVGSIAQDHVQSPGGNLEGELGGSATYFALAARHFGSVSVVGVVGRDREMELRQLLDFADLSRLHVVDQPTYTWRARRLTAGGEATTLERFTGAFEGYVPELGDPKDLPRTVFLGSCDPIVQQAAARACPAGAFIGGDTMDIFIEGQRPVVEVVLGHCQAFFATERELDLLSGAPVGVGAPRLLREHDLEALVVKRGAQGAIVVSVGGLRGLPACPTELVDPTGAGDALAGAFIGRLNELGDHTDDSLLDALQWGLVAASFAISGIGTSALRRATRDDLEVRLNAYRKRFGEAASPQGRVL